MGGCNFDFYRGVDERGQALFYLGVALLSFVVIFVGQWALATSSVDYGTDQLVQLFMIACGILGVYAAFRFYQVRHPR
ncbi:MAG: hypothetical protein ABSA63_08675 [Thermoplasmata archaeon]|jgi:hypothetical protein